jgi:hypothetical protein
VWNRQDALAYLPDGEQPDVFTIMHWHAEAWSGYEPRAFFAGCDVVHELYQRGDAQSHRTLLRTVRTG